MFSCKAEKTKKLISYQANVLRQSVNYYVEIFEMGISAPSGTDSAFSDKDRQDKKFWRDWIAWTVRRDGFEQNRRSRTPPV